MKKNLIRILLMVSGVLLFAQPRDFIATLECSPSAEITKKMNLVADEFEQAGYDEIAWDYRGYGEGWYGSGFLVDGGGGNILLVTNKHVTGVAEKIVITFENGDGDKEELNGSYNVFQDPYLDLAIIDVPDDLGRPALSLESISVPSDGDDVFSAGYPMLLGEPGWQLSKGVVSNSKASVNGIVSSEYTRLIQHTSAIDPGNSGGPLLVKSGDEWTLSGVNTWSVTSRNDTYFAIPADKVAQLVEAYNRYNDEATRTSYLEEKLEERQNDYISLLNEKEWDNGREHWDMSWDFSSDKGWNAFLALLEENNETYEHVGIRFGAQSPFQVLRESSLWWVWKIYNQQRLGKTVSSAEQGLVPSSVVEGDKVVSYVAVGDKKLKTVYVLHRGNWNIDEVEFIFPVTQQYDLEPVKDDEDELKGDEHVDLGGQLYLQPAFMNFNSDTESSIPFWGLGGYIEIFGNEYLGFKTGMQYLSLEFIGQSNDWDSEGDDVSKRFNGISFDLGLSLGYPLGEEKIFTPFLNGSVGFAMGAITGGSDSFDLGPGVFARYGGGVRYSKPESSLGLALAVENQSMFILDDFDGVSLNNLSFRIDVFSSVY